jgi:hypothetical protein
MANEVDTIFYSWQSDTPGALNRSFIERALRAAMKHIRSDATLEPAVRETNLVLDKDTQGIPGSPPIAQTILAKIDKAAVFVADLTFVGRSLPTLDSIGRLFPNPNVMIEYGYALKRHGHDRIITVLNTAFGESHTDNLPFDLRHLRWPIKYHLAETTSEEQKKAAFDSLVVSLSEAIRLILLTRIIAPAVMANDFVPRAATTDPSTFFEDPKDLLPELSHRQVPDFEVPCEGRAYLRLYSLKAVPPITTELEARILASKGGLKPMATDLNGWDHSRNVFGAIAVDSPVDGKLYHFTQLFLSRELWGVDALAVNKTFCREFTGGRRGGYIASVYVERMFAETLSNYLKFARESLQLTVPLQIEAGLTGIKGYPIAIEHSMPGRFLQDTIQWTGTIPSYDVPVPDILRPFFDYMWAKCGLVRPDHYQEVLARQFSTS